MSGTPLQRGESDEEPPLRLGAVRYLNALPLLDGLDEDPGVAGLVKELPSRLGRLLEAGAVDCALAPVVLFTEIEGLQLVDAPVIGCDGPVLTVRLCSRVPFGELRRVHADPASRTSNALCRIVLERMNHGRGASETVEVGSHPEAPAFVVIGDAAFAPPPATHPHVQIGRAHV